MSGQTHRRGRTADLVLAIAAKLVPEARRATWVATWQADLEYLRERRTPAAAELRFVSGAIPAAVWELRDAWRPESLLYDVRYAARSLWRSPAFTLISIATLALGIGVNATVFSALNGLIFRAPAGIGDPGGLVQIGRNAEPDRFDNWSWPVARALQDEARPVFSGVAGYAATAGVVGTGPDAEPVSMHLVSGSYFPVLRVGMTLGRGIAYDDAAGTPENVVVISEALWARRFGRDPGVIGSTLSVNSVPLTVIGVAAKGFHGADTFRMPADLFVPIALQGPVRGRDDDVLRAWDASWVWVVARLAPGAPLARAEAATGATLDRLAADHPELRDVGWQLVPGVGARPDERKDTLSLAAILLALAGLVLLIAAANLGALAMARAAARRAQTGMRYALGATRGRVLRHTMLESMILGAIGGGLAVAISAVAAPHLLPLLPVPVSATFAPDTRVLAFGVLVGIAAGVVFALAPVLYDLRTDPVAALRGGEARGMSGGRALFREGLVACDLALSFVVVAAAALLMVSMRNVRAIAPGFDPSGVFVVTLGQRPGAEGSPGGVPLSALLDDVGRVPGVEHAALAARLPIVDPQRTRGTGGVNGAADGDRASIVVVNDVSEGYFETLNLPVVRGRAFEQADASSGRVVVIDERAARQLFGDADPMGRALPLEVSPGVVSSVVGVVSAHRTRGLTEPETPVVYAPLGATARDAALLVRAVGSAESLRQSVIAAIGTSGTDVVVRRAGVLDALMTQTVRGTYIAARLVGVFGMLALALAAIGLYGTLAETVARRRREIGIRMALGATRGSVITLVAGRSGRIVAIGLGAGLVITLAGGRWIEGLLYGAESTNPGALVLSAVVLVCVAIGATLVPLRRALGTNAAAMVRD